jgi:hypothetical protein
MIKKLEVNGICGSGRMNLPKYREPTLEHNRKFQNRVKPFLNEEELGIIAQGIGESFATRCIITLILIEPFVDREVVGIVVRIEQYSKRIRVELAEDDYEWIKLDDIIKVIT